MNPVMVLVQKELAVSLEDPDFDNVHIELAWPLSV